MNELINEQREQIAQLTAERDTLAAQVEALRGAAQQLSFEIACDPSEPQFKSFSRLQDVVAENSQHHLRQVRADAGRKGYIAASLSWMGLKNPDGINFPDADRYHASILAGKE